MPLPIVHLNDIPDEGLEIEASIEAAWLEGVLEGSGFTAAGDPAGEVHVRLDRNDRDVLLSGSVDVRTMAACVSCLEPTPVAVHGDFSLNLEPAADDPHGNDEVELSPDELDADVYAGDKIDVGAWVREQILLELPAHPRCVDGCAQPIQQPAQKTEAPRGIDPRLAPLQYLSAKKKE